MLSNGRQPLSITGTAGGNHRTIHSTSGDESSAILRITLRQTHRRSVHGQDPEDAADVGWTLAELSPTSEEKIHLSEENVSRSRCILEQRAFSISRLYRTIRRAIQVGFFPKDYPHSVKPQYFGFALMMALGLGAATSAGVSAGINWVLKDGIGQLGGVVYASLMSSKFDSEPKRFRWTSTLLLHAATLLELLTPMFPHLFVVAASLSNIGKNVGWLALGASKAAILKTMMLKDNLGDLTGKAGAQNTFAGLVGTALGVLVSYAFPPTTPTALLTLFVPLSLASMFSIFMSSRTVVCETLNIQRGERIVRAWLQRGEGKGCPPFTILKTSTNRVVPTPHEVSCVETFLTRYHSTFAVPLDLEPLLEHRLHTVKSDSLTAALSVEATCRYLVLVAQGPRQASWGSLGNLSTHSSGDVVCLWYSPTASAPDHIRGFYHACVLRYVLEQKHGTTLQVSEQIAAAFVDKTAGAFLDSLEQQGWSVDYEFLAEAGRRVEVGDRKIDLSSLKD
ncbi:hypothetical protein HDU93_008341 [Gonapodya sp. JEL0774]|nr:hypothetical protein HDU93_008341 [Gonapodya sp. JEL0774]